MVKIICGAKGTGKTKQLIDRANDEMGKIKGHIIYIDDDAHHMYEVKHDIRFISMDEFPIRKPDEFYGFLCGLISNDFDIQSVYIDGIKNVIDISVDDLPNWLEKIDKLSEKYEINFHLTLSHPPKEVPEALKKYLEA